MRTVRDCVPTPAVEKSERRVDELFFGLRVIVVLIEPAPVNSFDLPIWDTAWRVAHDEHPSVAVVHPVAEAVIGFEAMRARPAMIILVAFGHLLGLSAGTRVPVDLHRHGGSDEAAQLRYQRKGPVHCRLGVLTA
jgi:hypothetical protein